MRRLTLAGILGCLSVAAPLGAAELAPLPGMPEKGTVRFKPLGDQKAIPERYRLDTHTFDYELSTPLDQPVKAIDLYRLSFPSPVVSETPENNTVPCEFYRPRGKGPFPAVVILDILAGDQTLSRTISAILAENGIAALFMQMPYYGPRRPEGCKLRLLSPDYDHSMEAVRQTVLDVRRAGAWLESRPDIDTKRLGILGTSLGSFMGSLSAEMEPRFRRVVIVLGGGGLIDGYYDDPRAAPFRKTWEAIGGTRDGLARLVAPADPLTHAANLKDRQVLMIAAKRDDIVPPKMAEALWKATGQQKIVWYDTTHYGAALYLVPASVHIVKHLRAE